ncbi:MAG: BolA family transcriptional regulator [Thiotrichaceae bacterium]|nr:BolA family transcriptional regulator [Thiotrichaceae bacterium]
MSMHDILTEKLQQAFKPAVLNIENESHLHSGPATESHFKITIVSDEFNSKMLIARHRAVNTALKVELENIHALSLHTLTAQEYADKSDKLLNSPACEGGGKT